MPASALDDAVAPAQAAPAAATAAGADDASGSASMAMISSAGAASEQHTPSPSRRRSGRLLRGASKQSADTASVAIAIDESPISTPANDRMAPRARARATQSASAGKRSAAAAAGASSAKASARTRRAVVVSSSSSSLSSSGSSEEEDGDEDTDADSSSTGSVIVKAAHARAVQPQQKQQQPQQRPQSKQMRLSFAAQRADHVSILSGSESDDAGAVVESTAGKPVLVLGSRPAGGAAAAAASGPAAARAKPRPAAKRQAVGTISIVDRYWRQPKGDDDKLGAKEQAAAGRVSAQNSAEAQAKRRAILDELRSDMMKSSRASNVLNAANASGSGTVASIFVRKPAAPHAAADATAGGDGDARTAAAGASAGSQSDGVPWTMREFGVPHVARLSESELGLLAGDVAAGDVVRFATVPPSAVPSDSAAAAEAATGAADEWRALCSRVDGNAPSSADASAPLVSNEVCAAVRDAMPLQVPYACERTLVKPLVEWMRRWLQQSAELDDRYDDSESADLSAFVSGIVIVGPSGTGKSASVHEAASQCNFRVLEVNTSSRRSKRDVLEAFGEATQSHQVASSSTATGASTLSAFDTYDMSDNEHAAGAGAPTQSLILFEDVDVLFDKDAGFMGAVVALLKSSKRPIVLTCNKVPPSFFAVPRGRQLGIVGESVLMDTMETCRPSLRVLRDEAERRLAACKRTALAEDDAGARDAIVAALLVASGGDCRRLRWLCDFWLVDQRARALRVADLVRAILDSTTDHVGGTHAIVVPSTWTGVPMARCSLDAAVNDASVRVVADESAPRTHGEVRARLLHYLALVEAFTALDVRPRHVDRDIDAAAELALVDAWLASVAGCASGGEPASCAGVRRAVDRAALPCELSIAMLNAAVVAHAMQLFALPGVRVCAPNAMRELWSQVRTARAAARAAATGRRRQRPLGNVVAVDEKAVALLEFIGQCDWDVVGDGGAAASAAARSQ